MKCEISAAERPSGQWRHQDRHLLLRTGEGDDHLLIVMDGHGESEHTIDRCMELLPLYAEERFRGEPFTYGDEMLRIFADLADETRSFPDGCSLSIVHLAHKGKFLASTLGDTAVVWGHRTDWSHTVGWLRPHDAATHVRERERLAKMGATVAHGYVHREGYRSEGLSMSRGLGNADFDAPLSREPDMQSGQLLGKSYLALATDGFIDLTRPDWFSILPCLEEKMPARDLLLTRHNQLRDDATVIVVYAPD